jgi:hypothetical protein
MSDDDLANNPDYIFNPYSRKYVRKRKLNASFTSRDVLEASVGCRLPEAYFQLVRRAFDGAQGDAGKFTGYYYDIRGNSFGNGILRVTTHGRDDSWIDRALNAPFEWFPLENMGVDSIYFGILDLAPELELRDIPFAQFDPMDGDDGVWIQGRNVAEAYDTRVTEYLESVIDSCDFDRRWKQMLAEKLLIPESSRTEQDRLFITDSEEVFARVGTREDPPPDHARAMTDLLLAIEASDTWEARLDRLIEERNIRPRRYPPEVKIPAVAEIPRGYAYLPCHDKVGTLAPCSAFRAPIESTELIPRRESAECLARGKEALLAGYPGTALHFLRCGRRNTEPDEEFTDLTARAYRALNRESLAKVVELMFQEALECKKRMPT